MSSGKSALTDKVQKSAYATESQKNTKSAFDDGDIEMS